MTTRAIAAAEHARARAARDAVAAGDAYTVRYTTSRDGAAHASTLCYYDALALARDLVSNPGFGGVTILDMAGAVVASGDSVLGLRY